MWYLLVVAAKLLLNDQSDEVYDDGEDFTVKEYKTMADEFAMRWIKREQPPELLRRNPRKVKAEVKCFIYLIRKITVLR